MKNTKALFILSHHDFYDDEYFQIKQFLESINIKTAICSTHLSEAQGRFKKIVKPDCLVGNVSAYDYDVFIFVGGSGASEFYHNMDVHTLVQDALALKKIMVMIGEAVPILYYANAADGRNITTLENLKYDLETAGAYYTGANIEQDGDLITGYDERSIGEISPAILRSLEWQRK